MPLLSFRACRGMCITMKKLLSIFLIACFSLCIFSACNSGSTGGEPSAPENGEITKMYITVNDNKLEVTLAENSATERLAEILKEGDIVYTASDYGGFEKVGSLGHTLPRSDEDITTEPGDIMLYLGNQIVIFYGSNSWAYTRLGKINGYSASALAEILGAGNGAVQITISLT